MFVGLVGLRDPPRLEVREALDTCKGAGIRWVLGIRSRPRSCLASPRLPSPLPNRLVPVGNACAPPPHPAPPSSRT